MFYPIIVEYEEGLPTSSEYWSTIEKDSLVVLDDCWYEAANNEEVSLAFKVYARKQRYSIICISQSFFETAKRAKIIRKGPY